MYNTLAENYLHPLTISNMDCRGSEFEGMHIAVTFENACSGDYGQEKDSRC